MSQHATGAFAVLLTVLTGCYGVDGGDTDAQGQAREALKSAASIEDASPASLVKVKPSKAQLGKACLNPTTDVAVAYNNSETVFAVQLSKPLLHSPRGTVRYHATVLEAFKGCADEGSSLLVQFRRNSTQAQQLEIGGEYLLNGKRIRDDSPLSLGKSTGTIIAVDPCNLVQPLIELSDADNAFLSSRYNCCGNECACVDGSEPFSCLVNPCENSACSVEGATCQANYCGGCNAEWTDTDGAAVCEAECAVDADCNKDSWCRDDQDGQGQCVAYSEAWGSCEGYMPPWMVNQCAPELQCVPIEPTGDLGGVCAACNYNGTPHQAGESFPAEDGCNTCTCQENGSVACTLIGCVEPEEESCVAAGCSNEVCFPESEDVINTVCVWKPEYDCLQYSSCGNFGAASSCGWEQTPEYIACLQAINGPK